jgi:large subunit ribosomal protein L17
MRHYKKGRKLGTDASHTKAIKKSLVVALFKNDRIKTTLARAKEIRSDVDRVVTWAKRGDVHSRRLAIAALGDKDLVAEIFTKVEQGLFKDRPGGYTRILRLGNRRGDATPIVIMELVQEPVVKKETATEPAAKKTAGRSAGKGAKAEKTAAGEEATDIIDIEPVVDEATEEVVETAEAAATETEAVVEETAEAALVDAATAEEAPAEAASVEAATAEAAPVEATPAEEAKE